MPKNINLSKLVILIKKAPHNCGTVTISHCDKFFTVHD